MNAEHTRQLWNDYPILYRGRKYPLTQSLIPFGFECGDGWFRPIQKLSAALELMNIYNRKYGVVVEATQTKQKFGSLRFYYNVTLADPSLWRKALAAPFRLAESCLGTNFKFEHVNRRKNEAGVETYDVVVHPVWRHWLWDLFSKIQNWIEYASINSHEREVVMTAADNAAYDLINVAEDECYNTCEDCGCQIGIDYSPRCETQGWITYLCDKCAAKKNVLYTFKDPKTNKTKWFIGDTDVTTQYEKEEIPSMNCEERNLFRKKTDATEHSEPADKGE